MLEMMYAEYSREIIAFVALIILFIIYEIIKIKTEPKSIKKKKFKDLEEPVSNEATAVKLDEYDDNNGVFHDVIYTEIKERRKKKREKQQQEAHPILEKIEKKVEESKPTKKESKYVIDKRSVPPHGKITKEDFKEFAGTRILVAEDNVINQKVIKGLLADTGIEIVIANDGQEALDILEKDRNFLMILMDAHMPRVDGFEATRIIRKNPRYDRILVVALSGDTASDDIRKMEEAGMSEQLEKPLNISSLYDILYAYTGQSTTIKVPMTQELNGAVGLEVCGGDEKFYDDILHEFVDMYENSTHELGDFLHNKQFKEANKLLLDIIGVTANIGAEGLNVTATSIKTALADKNEKFYLELVDIYKEQLDELISDIISYHRS